MLSLLPEVEKEASETNAKRPGLWRSRGAALRACKGKLFAEVLPFDAAGEKRWYVRAKWTLDDVPAFLMSAIVRPGRQPVIEYSDPPAARFMRYPEFGDHDSISLESVPQLVNVFRFGTEVYLLLEEPGLESRAWTAYRYEHGNLIPVGVQYSFGC